MDCSLDQQETVHDLIAERAYQLWEERGRPWGSPEVDWQEAVRELCEGGLAKLNDASTPPFSAVSMEPAEM